MFMWASSTTSQYVMWDRHATEQFLVSKESWVHQIGLQPNDHWVGALSDAPTIL